MQIKYEDVPFGYAHCMNTQCHLAEKCLRSIAWQSLSSEVDRVTVLNPATTEKSELCPHFRSSDPVHCAAGFTGMQKRMYPAQFARFSALLKTQWGRNPYYERRKGQCPLPPAEQDLVRQALKEAGADEALDFDGYTDRVLW